MRPQNKLQNYHTEPNRLLPLGLLAGAAGLAAWGIVRHAQRNGSPLSDSSRAARRRKAKRGETVVSRAVTINKPRTELYEFWRDFSRLSQFMENVERVERIDDKHSEWTIAGPAGREIKFRSTIVEEKRNELIAWRSDEDAPVRNRGRIEFRDAPGGRGTEVTATITYKAPGGEIGRLIAKLFQREPNIQVRRDLKRFKQLMETGEVADAKFHHDSNGAERRT